MLFSRPPKGWPRQGAISVEALEVRYRADQPTVLRGLTFRVSGAQYDGHRTFALSTDPPVSVAPQACGPF